MQDKIHFFFGMENTALVVGTSVVRGIGYAGVMGVQFAIIGDSVEYGEWKTGVRSEGLVFSARSFGCKVGMVLGNALISGMLSWGKYDGEPEVQPHRKKFFKKPATIRFPQSFNR